MLALIELNDENFIELSKLKLKENQKSFVKDFNACIEYKKENPFLKIYGIKDLDIDRFVGLTAFARWDSNESIPVEERWCWFDEFFIDKNYQHMGYGKQAIPMILKLMKEIYNPKFIILSVCNDNDAKYLYKELGFIKTNLIYDENSDSCIERPRPKAHDEIIMYKLCSEV